MFPIESADGDDGAPRHNHSVHAIDCADRGRRGSRLLSDWIRGIRAGFGAQSLQLCRH